MTARLAILATSVAREAIRALLRHKTRSALTTLGVTIGVAAVVLVVAIGRAGSERAQAELQKLGDNLVWVEAGSRTVSGVRIGSHATTTLTLEDADAIRREVLLINRVAPQIDGNARLIWGNRNWMTRFRGSTPDYLAVRRWALASGTAFSDHDVEQAAPKILIGRTVREQLFGETDPVGQIVRINSQPFEVVGLLASKGQNADGRDQDDWVFLPYTTAQKRLRGSARTWLDDIFCSAVSADAVVPAIDQVVALLRERHHIEPGRDDDFNIRRPDEVLKAQRAASDALALLLISVAAVSLLVGGIGIMNVMLASVAQRTREIGIRLAVGARARDIRLQFLGEAVTLSACGGIFGVALSVVGAYAFEKFMGWPIALSVDTPAVAILSSATVGVFFGFYPAWRASRLDPIDALRRD